MDDFVHVVQRVSTLVLQCIKDGASLSGRLDSEQDSIFIKDVDGRMLHTNEPYNVMFSGEMLTMGRQHSSFLSETLSKIAQQSDNMLLAGAETVQFDHIGHIASGREVRLRTFKRTLLGLGHPTMAILGMTRLLEVIGDSDVGRLQKLKDHWRLFSQLDDLDRAIAVGMGQGLPIGDIAANHSVTKKTIENHRNSILKSLELNSSIDLIKLMVRMQENGFGDFGV
ncbi:helix-turn-helix transcriptional regulator [Planctomycetes bacterium K23_9]|uniref:HTH luxR-type domain-containing protein n=1 Tax=Stieleria marina TaxID=1930275 RepID=A0A517NXL3_9BACT|nr:hypothetical protein K239x_38410 [Planctomycetes bacterium K23_9]